MGLGGEEKGEDLVESCSPCFFVVSGIRNDAKADVFFILPTLLDEEAVQEFCITDVTKALGGADIQPDAGAGPGPGLRGEGEDGAVIPPDGGAENGEAAEDVRVLEAEEEADETAERRTTEAGVLRAGQGAETFVDEGFELVEEEAAVGAALAAAHAEVARGGVLRHAAEAGVGDADEDDGCGQSFGGAAVRCGACAPGTARDV